VTCCSQLPMVFAPVCWRRNGSGSVLEACGGSGMGVGVEYSCAVVVCIFLLARICRSHLELLRVHRSGPATVPADILAESPTIHIHAIFLEFEEGYCWQSRFQYEKVRAVVGCDIPLMAIMWSWSVASAATPAFERRTEPSRYHSNFCLVYCCRELCAGSLFPRHACYLLDRRFRSLWEAHWQWTMLSWSPCL
jgi:hypothetical protein